MDAIKQAKEHADWFKRVCDFVYTNAWAHSRKHCLEQIWDIWENGDKKNFGKKISELLNETRNIKRAEE